MKAVSHNYKNESGMALLTVLLVMVLVSALAAGMFAAVTMEQRANAIDRDQTQVYSAAHGGLEKLTADLAALFLSDFSPSKTQLAALTATARLPNIPGFEYTAPGGAAGSGYAITWTGSPTSDPVPEANAWITAGNFSGLKGQLTRYEVTVTARSKGGACASTIPSSCSEVRLRRGLQTVAVPVFQFGVFSDSDLTFFGGDNFDFGGRVHTNANLWLSEAGSATLLFTDRITAYGDVHRKYLSNGLEASTNGMSGNVNVLTATGNLSSARTLKYNANESSVTNNKGGYWSGTTTADLTACEALTPSVKSVPCWMPNGAIQNSGTGVSSWSTVSAAYGGNLTNRITGATVLRLPLVSQGAQPIDLIKRPLPGEAAAGVVFGQRYFAMASLRILLSDRQTDITNLATVTSTLPVRLDGNWHTAADRPTGYTVDAANGRAPIARSIGPVTATADSVTGYSSGISQLNLLNSSTAMDPLFLAPLTMTVTSSNGTSTVTGCTARTANTFTGCTVGVVAIATGAGVLTAQQPSAAAGVNVTAPTTISSSQATGGGRTITLSTSTDAFPTAKFVAGGTIWYNLLPVTCEGYDISASARRFTRCRGLPGNSSTNVTLTTHATSSVDKGLIGGFIKVEKQNTLGVWSDVTLEFLNLGIGAPNQEGAICVDPTPTAVLRIQRLRDNGGACWYRPSTAAGVPSASPNAYDWWPNALYDTREGNFRPGTPTTGQMALGGLMGYISLDVNNLKRWLAGSIGTTGSQTLNVNGYIVYFSDRRGDHNENVTGDPETGQYGFENVVNPPAADGSPTAATPILETGEDFNGNGVLDRWGETPHVLGVDNSWTGYNAPFTAATRPWDLIAVASPAQARMNRQVLFRRALKLVNAGIVSGVTSMPANGLTVASENPVYVQGNYNAGPDPVTNATETHLPAAVIADAVTILSNNWRDTESFENPDNAANRPATTTGYRFAVVTGKSLSFPWPTAGTPNFLFGTDGGAGNFLRLMENWRVTNVDLNYRGSMVSLYFSQQATGTFKYHSTNRNVYDYADRNFKFDDEFLQPALLPPGTPMFRDINLLSFRQILRPNQ